MSECAVDRRASTVLFTGGILAFMSAALTNCSSRVLATPNNDIDTVAEEEAIRKINEEFSEAISAKDVDRVVSLVTDDVLLLTRETDPSKPDEPLHLEGRETVRLMNERFFRVTKGMSMKAVPSRIEISKSGDLAYLVGDYDTTFEMQDGGSFVIRGRYLFVLRNEMGSWKIAVNTALESVVKQKL